MLLSVVVVTFNAADAVGATLASVSEQSCQDLECLVIDGDSRDETVAVARAFATRLSGLVVTSEPDEGLYDAMNKGIARAEGKYILFLNAGDTFSDRDIVEDFAALTRTLNRLPAMIYGHTCVQFHDGREFIRRVRSPSYIRHGQPTIHQSVFFRSDVHRSTPYPYNHYPISADYAAMAAIQKSHEDGIFMWDRVVSVFRNNPSGVSNRNLNQRLKDAWGIQRDIIGIGLLGRVASWARRALAHAFYNFRPHSRLRA